MPWAIRNGKPVSVTVRYEKPPIEVEVTHVLDEYACPECGRLYKTEAGLTKHLVKHG